MARILKLFLIVVRSLWTAIFHVGRFLNLWEPDNAFTVISISKVAMWATLAALMWVLLKGDASMLEIALSGLSSLASTGNYAYRRSVQARLGVASYRDAGQNSEEPCMEEPFEDEPEV